jgi:S1-C subfamily serine protease
LFIHLPGAAPRARFAVRRTIARTAILAALLAAAVGLAREVSAAGNSDVVYCYDKLRGVVARELAAECKGEVVSKERAEEVEQSRQQRLKGIVGDKPQPMFAGLKLVGIGTAFFVNETGNMLTNHHVINDCKGVSIETPARENLPASVVAVDIANDLALLATNRPTREFARFRPNNPMTPGAAVATIGYPNQGMAPITPLVTAGHYLDVIGIDNARQRMRISADIRHGNSGGPLLDEDGLVVGIVNAKIDTVKTYQLTKQVVDNLGYVIPGPTVTAFLERNRSAYLVGREMAPMTPDELLAAGKVYIARAGCWK